MFRSVFFGTPEIAVPALRALVSVTEVAGVVCQPDRPSGRGLKLQPPPVKETALELGLDVFQPLKVKDGTLLQWLTERRIDVAVVLAYGRILPPPILECPRFGCINLHASLLPKYRGAAPINWAIFNGELRTGISLMQMDAGLDTGPIFERRELDIPAAWNAGQLSHALAQLAAQMIHDDLSVVFGGQQPSPQDPTLATYAPPFGSAELTIDWSRSALAIHNQVRAFGPRPGAHSWLAGKRLRLLESEPLSNYPVGEPVGQVVVAEGAEIVVQTGHGGLRLLRAQLEGKKELGARDLVNGRVLRVGQQLGSEVPLS